VLPDTAKEKPQRGRVLAVGAGPGTRMGSTSRWTWRRVTRSSSPSTAAEIRLGTDEVLILRESDVLAKVVGDREPVGAKA
jgi:chaperonin GroES